MSGASDTLQYLRPLSSILLENINISTLLIPYQGGKSGGGAMYYDIVSYY